MLPWPEKRFAVDTNLRNQSDAFTVAQLEKDPLNVAEIIVAPGDTAEALEKRLVHPRIKGFKCYYLLADQEAEGRDADPETFLPEGAWELANQKGLVITLHLTKHDAIADPDNIRYIRTMAKRYPNAQLVLAHCARGFSSWNMMKAIKELEDQGNIWFDLSAICESGPMAACILKNAGKRTMWGSDYPASMLRGRAVGVGKWQDWLVDEHFSGPERALIPAENLLAFYHAALLLDLDQTQIDDIFYHNAETLFGKE
jgi:glutamate-1-semialdehyde 2,1-aminomutase